MEKILKEGETLLCPHCQNPQCDDEPVEDFVIPGCVGDDSEIESECDCCYKKFTVRYNGEGVYMVGKTRR